jgi:hypothetical protein
MEVVMSESKFKVGDRVRCIDGSGSSSLLKEGYFYKVAKVLFVSHDGTYRLKFCNEHGEIIENTWYETRFELVEETTYSLNIEIVNNRTRVTVGHYFSDISQEAMLHQLKTLLLP